MHMVKPNPTLFTAHIPITEWQRLLNEDATNSKPVRHTYSSAANVRQPGR